MSAKEDTTNVTKGDGDDVSGLDEEQKTVERYAGDGCKQCTREKETTIVKPGDIREK